MVSSAAKNHTRLIRIVVIPTLFPKGLLVLLRSLGATRAGALAGLTRALAIHATTVALRLLLAVNLDKFHLSLLRRAGGRLLVRVLRAAAAAAFAGLASADAALGAAVARSAVCALDVVKVQVAGAGLLAGLQAREVAGLVVHVQDLLLALRVESADALAGRGLGGLLEVRGQAAPALVSARGDAVLLVDGLGLLGGLVLAVELLQGGGEAVGDAVLLVEGDRALNRLVAQHISVGQVLGEDAASRLVLLRDVLAGLVGVSGGLATCELVQRRGGADVHLVCAKLGVIQKEGGFGSGLFLEGHGGGLGSVGLVGVGGHGEVGDLAAVGYVSLAFSDMVSEERRAYQKLKKSLTSFSVVWWLMPLTWTVLDMMAVIEMC